MKKDAQIILPILIIVHMNTYQIPRVFNFISKIKNKEISTIWIMAMKYRKKKKQIKISKKEEK